MIGLGTQESGTLAGSSIFPMEVSAAAAVATEKAFGACVICKLQDMGIPSGYFPGVNGMRRF